MPTYEYRCDSCKRRYERRESFSAASTHTCDRCKNGTAKRILHAPTVVFKGSGFYVTDNKKSQESKSSDGGGESGDKKTSESSKSEGSKGTSSKGDSAKGKSAKSSESSSKP